MRIGRFCGNHCFHMVFAYISFKIKTYEELSVKFWVHPLLVTCFLLQVACDKSAHSASDCSTQFCHWRNALCDRELNLNDGSGTLLDVQFAGGIL